MEKQHKSTEQIFAVKIPKEQLEMHIEQFKRFIGHDQKHLVPILEVREEGGDLLIMEEYLRGCTLAKLAKLHEHARNIITREDRSRWFDEIEQALHYLHNFSPYYYVHGDVHPDNIIIDQDRNAWLVDFSSMKQVSGINRFFYRIHGNSQFTDPRFFSDGVYDKESDFYGLQATFAWLRKQA